MRRVFTMGYLPWYRGARRCIRRVYPPRRWGTRAVTGVSSLTTGVTLHVWMTPVATTASTGVVPLAAAPMVVSPAPTSEVSTKVASSVVHVDLSTMAQHSEAQPVVAEHRSRRTRLLAWMASTYRSLVTGVRICLRGAQLFILAAIPVLASPFLLWERTRPLWWTVLVRCIEVAGPTFIKLGQWCATRPDLFPPSLCEQMSRLHHGASVHDFAHTLRVIERETGSPLSHTFRWIDETPLGSGCVAQVHEAQLVTQSGNERVVVKVLHPQVRSTVELDMKLLRLIVRALSAIPGAEYFGLHTALSDFKRSMLSQMDLLGEAHNLQQFQHNFNGRSSGEHVHFPSPILNLCTEHLLVEEKGKGVLLSKVLSALASEDENDAELRKVFTRERCRLIASRGILVFLQMVLKDNFAHGDGHPGNVLVHVDEESGETDVTLIDVGLVSQLTPRDRRNFLALFIALACGDGRRGARLMLEGARSTDCPDVNAFEDDMDRIFTRVAASSFGQVALGSALTEVISMVRKHRVELEGNFATLLFAIVVLEGVGRQLDPELALFHTAIKMLLMDVSMHPEIMRTPGSFEALKRYAREKLGM